MDSYSIFLNENFWILHFTKTNEMVPFRQDGVREGSKRIGMTLPAQGSLRRGLRPNQED